MENNTGTGRVSIHDVYQTESKFLKAADIPKSARPIVQIESYDLAEVGEEKKKQIVLHFKGKAKVLGLNVTNSTRIAALIGSEYPDDWIGYKIRIYTSQTTYGGKTVDCIRVSEEFVEAPPERQAPRAGNEQPGAEEIPF